MGVGNAIWRSNGGRSDIRVRKRTSMRWGPDVPWHDVLFLFAKEILILDVGKEGGIGGCYKPKGTFG